MDDGIATRARVVVHAHAFRDWLDKVERIQRLSAVDSCFAFPSILFS